MVSTGLITKKKCLETAVVLTAVILFIGWKFQDWRYIIVGIVVLFLSLIVPIIFYPLAKLWFGLGTVLGFVSTKILLTVIFFLIVAPIGVFRNWIGKDSLHLKSFKKNSTSVFNIRNHKFSPEDLKNPY